jgi:Protein of unknown function (DUF3800)
MISDNSMHVQDIFCDESGFTGNDLLHQEQSFFTFATVATTSEEAQSVLESVRRKHNIVAPEIKGSSLLKAPRYHSAVTDILTSFAPKAKLAYYDKHFALCCKFFEYIFEPLLSENNALFYSIGFHKHIATLLCMASRASEQFATAMLADFQNFMRGKTDGEGSFLFGALEIPHLPPGILHIRTIASSHRDRIIAENQSIVAEPNHWILELSVTSLFSILSEWGTEFGKLRVHCDDSKPLLHQAYAFDPMLNREESAQITFDGRTSPFGFSLAEPIRFAASCDCPALQVADVIASSAYALLRGTDATQKHAWIEQIDSAALSNMCVMPDAIEIDLSTPRPCLNALVLEELTQRTRQGRDLLHEMPEFVSAACDVLHRDLGERPQINSFRIE